MKALFVSLAHVAGCDVEAVMGGEIEIFRLLKIILHAKRSQYFVGA